MSRQGGAAGSSGRGARTQAAPEDTTADLGKTIQRLRKAYNMSLGDLSEQSGVAKSIISQIERNETNPTLSTVYRLSRALDTTIDEVLRTRSPRRAVVVGGGYIGLEMVEALVLRGLEVTMVEKLPQPMATLDPDMGERVAEALRAMGVTTRLGVGVAGFGVGADGWVDSVGTDDGDLPADLVVMGLGVRPSTRLAVDAGIPVGSSGGIVTDARMATPVDGVWAAGDCVESFHRVSRRAVSIALGTHANKQGRVAGLNLSGTPARFPGVIGTAITKIGTTEIARTGLNEREAAQAGFDAVAGVIEGTSRAHYYPDGAELAVKVVAERGSGRILGAQIVGGPESAKRIDALAVAVWDEMTVDEFSQLDLAYAPPFSPVWDPTMIATRTTASRVR